jgi:hypothetical protein
VRCIDGIRTVDHLLKINYYTVSIKIDKKKLKFTPRDCVIFEKVLGTILLFYYLPCIFAGARKEGILRAARSSSENQSFSSSPADTARTVRTITQPRLLPRCNLTFPAWQSPARHAARTQEWDPWPGIASTRPALLSRTRI